MGYFEIFTVLILMLAIISIINEKILHFPFAIGVTIASILVSISCILLERVGVIDLDHQSIKFLSNEYFSKFLLQYMLGFLLFAGALHVKLDDLKKEKFLLFTFSTVGVLIYSALFGVAIFAFSNLIGFEMTFIIALLIGVILSPTDPIAVMSILNACYVPKRLKILISGESLFNDGVSYSLFIIVAAIAFDNLTISISSISHIIFNEIVMSLVIGLIISVISLFFIKQTKEPVIAIIISIAAITLTFSLSEAYHFSGPLGVVIIGLLYSKYLHNNTFSKEDEKSYFIFWNVFDKILNGLLFLIIGLELSTLEFSNTVILLSIIAIVLNLIIRFISVMIPTLFYHMKRKLVVNKFKLGFLLTWGGLRGGLSLALIMSLGEFENARTIISFIYFVIIFSIIIQGLTIKPMLEKHPLNDLDDI